MRRLDAFILTVGGSAVLLSTLFLGWYSMTYVFGPAISGETFYLTSVQLWGSYGPSTYSFATSFHAVDAGSTGFLYLVIAGFVVAGGFLGLVTSHRMWRDRDAKHHRFVTTLLVVTLLLALAGPVAVVIVQPVTVCADSVVVSAPLSVEYANNSSVATVPCGWDLAAPNGDGGLGLAGGTSPGPQESFFGTNNVTGPWLTWEPSIGWYVATAASVLLLIGTIEYSRSPRISTAPREDHDAEVPSSDARRNL